MIDPDITLSVPMFNGAISRVNVLPGGFRLVSSQHDAVFVLRLGFNLIGPIESYCYNMYRKQPWVEIDGLEIPLWQNDHGGWMLAYDGTSYSSGEWWVESLQTIHLPEMRPFDPAKAGVTRTVEGMSD